MLFRLISLIPFFTYLTNGNEFNSEIKMSLNVNMFLNLFYFAKLNHAVKFPAQTIFNFIMFS